MQHFSTLLRTECQNSKCLRLFICVFFHKYNLLYLRFGLILPGQQKKAPLRPPQPPTRPSIFDESSNSADSDDDAAGGAPQRQPPSRNKPGSISGPSQMERRRARDMQEKALAEDASIFQYDELYDEMANKRDEAKEAKKNEPRKAKYIGRLIEHAERRKLENELRVDRQVQKDREAEGEMYKDKDTYVTAAYRKKLESLRQLQEQDKRDEYLEAIGDVTKQKDLDGFYRHLYEQKLGTQQPVLKPKTAPSTDEVAYKPIKCDLPSGAAKQRTYRQRRASEDEEQPAEAEKPATTDDTKPPGTVTKAHLPNNIDADSDFSIDSSEDEEEPEEITKPVAAGKDKEDKQQAKQESTETIDTDKDKPVKETPTTEAAPKHNDLDDTKNSTEADVPQVVKPPPVDRTLIWRKRTVGEAFDAAVERYQERKLARRAWSRCNLPNNLCALRPTWQYKYSPLPSLSSWRYYVSLLC